MHRIITTFVVLYFLFIPRIIDAKDSVRAKGTSSAKTGDSLVSAVSHDTSRAESSVDTTGIKKDSIDTVAEKSETADSDGQTGTVASEPVSKTIKNIRQRN